MDDKIELFAKDIIIKNLQRCDNLLNLQLCDDLLNKSGCDNNDRIVSAREEIKKVLTILGK